MNLLSTGPFDWSKFNPTWLMFTISLTTIGSSIFVALVNNCHTSRQKRKEQEHELSKIDAENTHKEKIIQMQSDTSLEIKRLEQINNEKMSRINDFMMKYGVAVSEDNEKMARGALN